jgi:voltage-gated potassium channel Kch
MLSRIGRCIDRAIKPGMLWALLYLAAIIAYACVYQSYGSEFYQSTALQEAKTCKSVDTVKGKLTTLFHNALATSRTVRSVTVTLPDAASEKLSFVVSYRFMGGQRSPVHEPERSILCTLSIPSNDASVDMSMDITDQEGDFISRFSNAPILLRNTRKFGDLLCDFQHAIAEKSPATVHARLFTDDALVQSAREYLKATHGSPQQKPGSWWRWVYLSSVTITTLGYGDVVPLTDWARILVSSEAIAGVVIAGLFLSTVTSRRRKRQRLSSQPKG